MIVTDMDGTLLDAQHCLPSEFVAAVKYLRQAGIRWVIASGRQLANLKQRFDTLNVPVDIIAENGALAQCAGETKPFFCDLTPVASFTDVLNTAFAIPGATPVLCGATCAWVHGQYPENLNEVSLYFEEIKGWHHLQEVNHLDICKVAIYHPQAADALYPALEPFQNETLRVILSGPNWVDVQASKVDKAHALHALLNRVNVPCAAVMVFGDYFNDMGMMQGGVHAVAMANALPEIRALTPHQALPNTQNGVMAYLRRLHVLPERISD